MIRNIRGSSNRRDISRPGFCRGHRGPEGWVRAADQRLGLDDKDEDEATEEEPWPDPERNRLVVEQGLEGRRIGEQELQDHGRADAERQIPIAEVRLERERRVEEKAAVQQVE